MSINIGATNGTEQFVEWTPQTKAVTSLSDKKLTSMCKVAVE